MSPEQIGVASRAPETFGIVENRDHFGSSRKAPASSPAARDAGPISSAPAINDAATANFSLPNLIDEMVIVSASTAPVDQW